MELQRRDGTMENSYRCDRAVGVVATSVGRKSAPAESANASPSPRRLVGMQTMVNAATSDELGDSVVSWTLCRVWGVSENGNSTIIYVILKKIIPYIITDKAKIQCTSPHFRVSCISDFSVVDFS